MPNDQTATSKQSPHTAKLHAKQSQRGSRLSCLQPTARLHQNCGRAIFKPAVAKSGGKPEPFRAYVQEAVSQVQARVLGEKFVVPIKAVEVEGRFGTIQPLLSDVKGDLKKIPLADLTPDKLRMVQQEHVIDWLVGNFDSHPGNHIVLADGRIIGIDKEQAFRYIADPKSWRVSTAYHPNAVYGEAPPIGNTLYSAFAKK